MFDPAEKQGQKRHMDVLKEVSVEIGKSTFFAPVVA